MKKPKHADPFASEDGPEMRSWPRAAFALHSIPE